MAEQIYLTSEESDWSEEGLDFINSVLIFKQLIKRRAATRLGKEGSAQLIGHRWFKDFDWARLKDQTLQAPFAPNVCFLSKPKKDNFSSFMREHDEDNIKIEKSKQHLILDNQNV